MENGANGDRKRHNGNNGNYNNNSRKRRYRDDDEVERTPQRRRYEEPIASQLRRQLLVIAEKPARSAEDEARGIGRDIANNFDDDQVRGGFLDDMMALLVEQPVKIPFIAAAVRYTNDLNSEAAKEIIARAGRLMQEYLDAGEWREFKFFLRFFACLQGILEGDGVFSVFDQLFDTAADLQAASQEDAVGLELVKIILVTIPYALTSSSGLEQKALDLLENTDIIASASHPLENLANPFPGNGDENIFEYQSIIGLLQKQLVRESTLGWSFACIPRIYNKSDDAVVNKQTLPTVTVPSPVNPGPKPVFPEAFCSLYADLSVESVPTTENIACSLIRDVIVDQINVMDFNRIAVTKFLIDLDLYWAPGTFVGRSVPFDKIKDVEEGRSPWKPEDCAIDAVFSQLLLLPAPEHKLVYYHSVVIEACRFSPGAIAPSLGRAIRYVFKNLEYLDMELAYRFLDWFAHHISNYDFRWKWSEWSEEVGRPNVHPKKAFILSSIDKEIRLSFTKRIRESLPAEYHSLIPDGKEKDIPDFKYNVETTPYAAEGRQILALLRSRAADTELQVPIDAIHSQALAHGVLDPLVSSTDAYMTAICFIGSKSLSHVLSNIERCKERLLAIGAQSDAARRQIIQSVVSYWAYHPGTAVNIVDKLLNYTIVTPESVVQWALGPDALRDGRVLAEWWRYEMVSVTMFKVTNRVRQIVKARVAGARGALGANEVQLLDDTLEKERVGERALFGSIVEAVSGLANGATEGAIIEGEGGEEEGNLVRTWAGRWARVFGRKMAVEEAIVGEAAGVEENKVDVENVE
ncbi:cap binding protein [Trichodelitschia bisporula]|uniref:Cap binding protein n=1 Tax=Trichodelitschia bisporula TaxID=703511 RepID=A0A6G1I991_9PEZI|nr:cap binding protein [Trichodelitschia bisporula]